MSKKWVTIQTIISSLLQAWALYFLYALTDQILTRVNQGKQLGVIKATNGVADFGSLLRLYHINYITGILAFYGGFALLYEKKGGWMASAVSCLLFTGFMLVSGRNGIASPGSNATSYLIAGIIFATLFILLLLKPFREKYKPTVTNWLVMGGIVLLVIVDKQVF